MHLQTRAQLAREQTAPPADLARRTLALTGYCICLSALHNASWGCMHTHAVRLLLESGGYAGPSGAIRVEHVLCRGMPDMHSLVKKTIACRLSDRAQLWRCLQTIRPFLIAGNNALLVPWIAKLGTHTLACTK